MFTSIRAGVTFLSTMVTLAALGALTQTPLARAQNPATAPTAPPTTPPAAAATPSAKTPDFAHPATAREAERYLATLRATLAKEGTVPVWRTEAQRALSGAKKDYRAAIGPLAHIALLDDKTALPTPPKELDEQYRSRTVQLAILGDPHGDPSRCK